jgi:hypothetical protein
VAVASRVFQVGNVAAVDHVEGSVGQHDASPGGLMASHLFGKFMDIGENLCQCCLSPIRHFLVF